MNRVGSRRRLPLRWILVGVGVVIVIAGALLVILPSSHPRSPEELLDSYISALNDNDADEVASLIHRDVDATSDIELKLAKFGGQNIDVTNADISRTGMGGFGADVRVVGSGDRGPYRESLHFSADEFGDWYLDLGKVKE